jgi:hypothetical protein
MPDDATAELVLQRAERAVDGVIGPRSLDANALKYDPNSITATQKAALSRATCAAAEFRLQLGESALVGEDDYLPTELQPIRKAGRVGPKVAEELAGSGLIAFSGTVTTTT